MDIFSLLKRDHKELELLLEELISLRLDDDYRYVLIEEIRHVLIPHLRAEESVLYNTLRAIDADRALVFRNYQDHVEIETLLRTLQLMDRLNMDWKMTAERLYQSFLKHMLYEETEFFIDARELFTKDEQDDLGDAFEQLKLKIEKDSLLSNTFDAVVNLVPPRLADKIRNFKENHIH